MQETSARRVVASVLWAAPMFAVWLALTDDTRPLDMLVGGGCALLAGAAAEAAGLLGRVHFRPAARWLLRALALPWWIVRDSAIVLTAPLRRGPLEGGFVVVGFRSRGDGPRDVARRAVAYTLGSAGPNSYAIGGSEEHDLLVAHQLVVNGDITPAEVVREP